MRKFFPYLVLLLLVAWPQMWLNNYGGVVVALVLTGALMAWFESSRLIFLKGLLVGFISSASIYALFAVDHSEWVLRVFEQNGVGAGGTATLFIGFNTLNVAFCLLFGSSLVRLFRPVKKS